MSTLSLENEYTGAPGEAQLLLSQFWNRVADDVNATVNVDFKTQELPLARIKKIMKLDEDVKAWPKFPHCNVRHPKMISAEAPVLFAKAAEIFIAELTLRAWIHAEDNKRRTLQRNDIAMAIGKYDQFDFLIDIVPREEIRPARRSDEVVVKTVSGGSEQLQYFLQVPSGQQTQTPVIQQPVQLSSILSPQQNVNASAQQTVTQAAAPTPQHPSIQVYTQVVGANGEIQQIPIQLTQSQIQAIALQMQGKQPGQSIVIQTSPLDHQSQVDGASNVSNNTSHYSNTQPLFQMPMYIQHDNAEDDEGVEPEEEQTE